MAKNDIGPKCKFEEFDEGRLDYFIQINFNYFNTRKTLKVSQGWKMALALPNLWEYLNKFGKYYARNP